VDGLKSGGWAGDKVVDGSASRTGARLLPSELARVNQPRTIGPSKAALDIVVKSR